MTDAALPTNSGGNAGSKYAEDADVSVAKLIAEAEARGRALEARLADFEANEAARRKKEDEEKSGTAAKKDDEETDMKVYSRPEKPPKMIPEVNYVEWLDYKSISMDQTEEYAIDVLVGPPVLFWQRSEVPMLMAQNSANQHRNMKEVLDVQPEMPERCRVNSTLLLRIFTMTTMGLFFRMKPMVFLRPYKFFYYYERHLRRFYLDLKEKWKDGPQKKDDAAGQESAEGLAEDNEINNTNPIVVSGEAASTINTSSQEDAVLEQVMSATSETEQRRLPSLPSPPPLSALHQKHTVPPHPAETSESESGRKEDKMNEHDVHSYEAMLAMQGLMSFLDGYVLPVARRYREAKPEQIFFRDLWYLLAPGDEVVTFKSLDGKETVELPRDATGKGYPAIWKVLQVANGRSNLRPSLVMSLSAPLQKVNPFSITCYRIGYNGQWFGPITRTFDILPYDGKKDITSLDLVPSRYVDDINTIRSTLKDRGLRFLKYMKPTHQHYTGPALKFHPNGQECKLAQEIPEFQSNVVVDFQQASSDSSEWVPKLGDPSYVESEDSMLEIQERYPRYVWKSKSRLQLLPGEEEQSSKDTILDQCLTDDFISSDLVLSRFTKNVDRFKVDHKQFKDDDLVLLPDRVTAFDLAKRKFCILAMSGLKRVEVMKEGWSDLKLPHGHKKMLQAQVKSHFREKRAREANEGDKADMDIVRGKGQGLIVLLHGVPGVGKTSTAECIAESLRKPLYPITCGDLGVTAEDVEDNLREIFIRAEAWDCIVLLDEADVFLAQRTRTDIKRNAIVSVFLRILEYYRGILVLTTNRVGAFDEAFKSRIHLPLYYPVLNHEQSISIWRMNLERVRNRKGSNISIDEENILRFAQHHFNVHMRKSGPWNGRQIRNAVQTAAAIAEYEALDKLEDWEEGDLKDENMPQLKVAHFEIIANASDQFDQYISDTIGSTDAERAFADRDRANDLKWAATTGDVRHRAGGPAGYQSMGMAGPSQRYNEGGMQVPQDFNSYLQQTQSMGRGGDPFAPESLPRMSDPYGDHYHWPSTTGNQFPTREGQGYGRNNYPPTSAPDFGYNGGSTTATGQVSEGFSAMPAGAAPILSNATDRSGNSRGSMPQHRGLMSERRGRMGESSIPLDDDGY